jgi:hypothetical protein
MAVIRVKRGTTTPTTSHLTLVGELGFDYTNNALYARNTTSVVKIGGEFEEVYSAEVVSSLTSVTHAYNPNYIYKMHVIASTQGTSSDTSSTFMYYRTSGFSNLTGSSLNVFTNDVTSTVSKTSTRNTTTFSIEDAHSAGVTLTSGISKVIDFELSPVFSTGFTTTQQWVAYGKSITTVTGQGNASITLADFVHSFNGSIGNIYINPGLNLGSPDLISVTLYRALRK